MAFDPNIGDQLTTMVLTNAQNGAALTQALDRNLSAGMGTVNTNLVQTAGIVGISNTIQSDDAGSIAGLQTAAGAPQQGALQPK